MDRIVGSVRALGSPCEIQLYVPDRAAGEQWMALAVDELRRIERKYSRYRDDSVTSALNRTAGDAKGSAVDDETAALLDYAATAFEQSGGLFDITSGILRRAWNLRSGRVPSAGEVRSLLRCVGWQRVAWRRPRLVIPLPGMELDFGGFVKEYAADRVVALCRARGLRHGRASVPVGDRRQRREDLRARLRQQPRTGDAGHLTCEIRVGGFFWLTFRFISTAPAG